MCGIFFWHEKQILEQLIIYIYALTKQPMLLNYHSSGFVKISIYSTIALYTTTFDYITLVVCRIIF